jgi:hypothetical protein
MSHTPGPWYVEIQSGGRIEIQEEDGSLIAEVWDNGSACDNAQVIAAAPDLLAELKQMIKNCGCIDGRRAIYEYGMRDSMVRPDWIHTGRYQDCDKCPSARALIERIEKANPK